ncbi:MAG TPA: ABC transporter permease subunit [Streptosporangiaceae bacterium]|jgi:ABC-type transport system involved in multi-copper enzyme maturation permease subunit
MSTGTLPQREAEAAATDVGFGAVLRGEWTKFRTVRGWVVGVVVAGVLIVAMGVFGAGHANIGCQGPHGSQLRGKACLPYVPLGPGGEAVTDSYYFVHQPLGTHGSITVRMTALTGQYGGGVGPAVANGQAPPMHSGVQPWSKAGIMITASTKQGAAYAAIMATGSHGVAMQWNYTQDVAGAAGKPTATSPRWLRLTRFGDTITGYDSADGVQWDLVGTARLAGLAATVPAGMFATSPPYMHLTSFFGGSSGAVGPAVATGVFDHVRPTGGQPDINWTGTNVGNQQPYGTQTGQLVNYHQAGGTFTVTGNGDIAPDVLGDASQLPSTTIENHLVGVFAGLIAIVVVAAMFMTAEYRRGLIRTTLAASPRRGRVLVAKAIVVAGVGFAVGLVASVVAVGFGIPIDRAQGQYVLPVSWLTEVRVIGGTAALVAVAAALALALGTLVRRSAAAVTSAIVLIVLPFLLGVTGVPGLGAWLMRVTPAAAFAIQQSVPTYPQVANSYTVPNGYYPLAPWAGFGVLCLYAAVALGGAFFVLRRRDA